MIMDAGKSKGGFFSTFSIADPEGSTREGLGKPQKRNRRVFVCIPCHRRKLKCDKGQPCSRCVQSGTPNECTYQQAPGQKQEPALESDGATRADAQATPQTSPESSTSGGRARLDGATHWRTMAREFKEAWPYISGTDPQWAPRHQQILGLEGLFPSLPGTNFPFGNAFTYSQSRSQVLESLPPPQVVNTLVQCYFGSFESTHRLVHQQQFGDELNAFWINREQFSEGWLSQLCMMLALGCQSAPSRVLRGTGRTAEDWTALFLDAAQFFFGQSPYFTSPTLTTVRTLCLAVMARMTEIVKGTEMSHLVFLMGFVTRLAMTMQLHRRTSVLPEMTPFEAEMRKRIWITIQLLDLDIAMRTGTSYFNREWDVDAPLDINDSNFHRSEQGWVMDTRWASPGGSTDSTFQIKLANLLPVLMEVINKTNSPTQLRIEYERVRALDKQLRQKLQDAESILSLSPYGQTENLDKVNSTQIHFLRVLVHRTLLALHHDYASVPRAGKYPDSTLAATQSSLALLRTYQIWHTPPTATAAGVQTRASSSASSTLFEPLDQPISPLGWLTDLCHDDFGAAMFHLIVALRRGDLEAIQHGGLPSRSVASNILHQNLELVRTRACRSVPHFREFVALSVAVGCLESFHAGEPFLPTLLEVAGQIEQTVLQGGQELLWTQGSHPFSGQAGLSPNPFVYGYGQ
ncbi:hypothetical protein B0H67DRAFT_67238 [Lasiosphaeris hirsuta]|uniref:Zn(2)-C6 fungal-type domain-containing protein n=1 Tax=Lasiosphaeris hirsuta TaxID=260670 RepID=A0AA40EDG3_9PEZI|nr:hypothetical protein B0H67DRAFT_67238 [Lasiosphaeris hirsuta]